MSPRELAALKKFAKKLGGQLVLKPKLPGEMQAPFASNVGLDYAKKIVYFTGMKTPAGHVVHEMGHVFACDQHPDEMPYEWDFFGWEYAVVLYLKLDAKSWFKSQDDYIVDDNSTSFGSLTILQRKAVLEERLTMAKKMKLVKNNRPVSIR